MLDGLLTAKNDIQELAHTAVARNIGSRRSKYSYLDINQMNQSFISRYNKDSRMTIKMECKTPRHTNIKTTEAGPDLADGRPGAKLKLATT